MSVRDFITIAAELSSILGLVFSVWITIRTGRIQKQLFKNILIDEFNINREKIMECLHASGLNAVRETFPDKNLLFHFQKELISYSKKYNLILDKAEKKRIKELVELINSYDSQSKKWKSKYHYLLNEITTKQEIRR